MRVRVYIAIILLLLLLTVSQVCASGASRLSKKPTYKIRAFNSINKATKVTIIGSGPGCPYGLNPGGVVQNNCFEKTLSVTLHLRLSKSISS